MAIRRRIRMRRINRSSLLKPAFWILVFTWCVVFFYQIKPLVPYDLDDWTYIAYRRLAIPVWGLWNPSKVLPELLLPFCSEVGVRLIMPFLKDYLHSLSLSYALFTGALICAYLILMERMLKGMFKLSRFQAYLLAVFYLVLHFWLLRTSEDRNNHMLFAKNLNCFFNYVIPNVLNASLVLYFFCNDPEENSGRNYLQKGILFTAVYMGIFSNLFQEVVLVSFIGCRLVLKLIEMVKSKRTIPQYIKENKVSLSIIAAWLLTCIFEANGGRARSLTSVKMDVFTTVKNLIAWKDKLNKLCVAVCILLILAGVFTYIKSNKKDPVIKSYKKVCIYSLICMMLCLSYLVLLCSKTGSEDMLLSSVIFAPVFYGFILTVSSAALVLYSNPSISIILPILILICVTDCDYGQNTYKAFNQVGLTEQQCYDVGNYMINQLKQADASGSKTAELHVPYSHIKDTNWPHSTELFGKRFLRTMLRHGMISRKIELTIVPDESVNESFYIKY